jgi:dTDP-4-dehydrorhamnose 3,5-epimerase
VEPRIFADDRGAFCETFNAPRYADAGIAGPFVQDNLSVSRKGVLRGLHFQNPRPQGKLVSVARGAVFDVAVDLRRASPTFGRWYGVALTASNARQLWIPPGFAHGFLSLAEDTVFLYKCTDTYAPEAEGAVGWNDPDLAIEWPLSDIGMNEPLVSPKDAAAPRLADVAGEKLFP